MRLFAITPSEKLVEKVALVLNRTLDPLEERNFEDGEHKIRPLVSVRNEEVFLFHSLYEDDQQSVNDKLCKLLFLISTLKDGGAKSVTIIAPYLCYTRKDRRTKARDPVTMRYVAALFEAVGADRIVTMDVHNLQAYQNAFRCNTEHLEGHHLFAVYFKGILKGSEKVSVMSPDIGGIKRAEKFREVLSKEISKEVGFAFMEKTRSKGILSGDKVFGDVSQSVVIIFDDIISTGATMARASSACIGMGAQAVYVAATHGAFLPQAYKTFEEKTIKQVVITNTIFTGWFQETVSKDKLQILDTTPLFAEVVRRLYTGGSLVALMDPE